METAPLAILLNDLAERVRATAPLDTDADPLIIYLLAGAGLAALFGILLLRRGGQLRRARRDLSDRDSLREELIAARLTADRVPSLDEEITALRADRDLQINALAGTEAKLETERNNHAARLEELRGLNDALKADFRNLASEVLEGNSKAFLDRVSERFRTHKETADQELDARRKAIDALVKPLNERLTDFDSTLKEVEKARSTAYGSIREQVDALNKGQAALTGETRKLVQALRAPKTRGRWGEMQLRQVLELSGMSEHVDFRTEESLRSDDGLRRPDAVVRMPGGRSLVVDAKTPLDAYLDALEAETPEARDAALSRHAIQAREHVRALASKGYQALLEGTPDFVVMFIPGETFLAAAAEADPGLIERAIEARVLIATPTTLIALLRAIAFGWQQEAVAENALRIHREAKELYNRLGIFAEHLGKVGKALGRSVDSYNSAIGSLETRVLPTARKLEEMKVIQSPSDRLSQSSRIDEAPRRITAEELTAESGSELDAKIDRSR